MVGSEKVQNCADVIYSQFVYFFFYQSNCFAGKKIRQINLTSESEWELEADCDLRLRLFRGGGTLRLLADVDPVGGGYN